MLPKVSIEISDDFVDYAEAAVTRLSYLYPNYEFALQGHSLEVFPIKSDGRLGDINEIKRQVFYQLYRQRIYVETLSIRKSLYAND
ncbi:MAG: hypothetical protein WD078_15495 [Woeseia sp.]